MCSKVFVFSADFYVAQPFAQSKVGGIVKLRSVRDLAELFSHKNETWDSDERMNLRVFDNGDTPHLFL